jgi:hypothetical protein
MGRRAALLIALAALAIGAGAVVADLAGSWRFVDVWCFYHGGAAVVEHVDLYDPPTWLALTRDPARLAGQRPVKDPCPGAFGYPYWSALAFAPFALLPYDVAAGAWAALLLSGVVWGVILIARATGAPLGLTALLAAGSLALMRTIVLGQLTGLLLPLLGLSVLARPARSGLATALLALKPQLAFFYVPALMLRALVRRDRRFAIWCLGGLAGLAAASLIAWPAWPVGWWTELTTNRAELARPLPTASGLASVAFGDARWAIVLAAALVVAVAVLARGRRIDRVSFAAVAIAVSLFAVPYAYSYDHLFLLLPWSVVAAAAARASPRRRNLLLAGLVAAAIVLPWAIYAITFSSGNDTLNAVVPALAALLVTVSAPRGETMGSWQKTPRPS